MLLVGFDWRSSHLSCCTIPQIDRDMLDPRWLYPPFRYHTNGSLAYQWGVQQRIQHTPSLEFHRHKFQPLDSRCYLSDLSVVLMLYTVHKIHVKQRENGKY